MLKLILFACGTVVIITYSRKSLANPHSHGFFRFFAFEAILGLLLLNLDDWFTNPFSILHILSWLLLLASLILVTHGILLLHHIGRPNGNFENTTQLVKVGAFRYIRHPLYGSLLFLGWGAALKEPTLFTGFLVFLTTGALLATARVEEAENLSKFGVEYADYQKETKMFIPFLF